MRGPIGLARLPTPVQRLSRLSEREGVEIFVKRDDLTGVGLSGNKVRKLEWLLADALRVGATAVVTTGGLQSNHCRATAVACRQLGLEPVLLLRGEPPPIADGNLLLDQLLGAEVHLCTPDEYRHHRDARMEELAADLRARGQVPYVIPEGGSNARGSMGYVRASEELARQHPASFDAQCVAVGSGGTLAGLSLGVDNGPITGFAVCDDAATFTARVHAIRAEAHASEGGAAAAPAPEWRVEDGYRGEAYGVAGPEVWSVIADVARLEGLFLDPVYTGKAMHGLLSEVRAGRMGRRILFWHTGGVFGLFGRGAECPA